MRKNTKIICTIGPASDTKTRLKQMFSAGMNVARLNFSHGTYQDHAKLIKTIRTAAKESKKPIALLQDLQGPRIRTGETPKDGIEVRNGDYVIVVTQKDFEEHEELGRIPIPIQYDNLYKYVKPDGHIYIQDGIIDLKVQKIIDKKIHCRVVQGGVVFSHKGLNAPGVTLEAPVITDKDKEDVKFGIEQGIDYIALSFVKDDNDINNLRSLLPKKSQVKIIAKIERAEAIKSFDKILKVADGIMIARGDLGVELGAAEIPLIQKEIISKCLFAAKPVIVATQMLESMVNNPRPTRAEAADVANAIIDHTDAIMLSAESATGKFPVKAVRTMSQIARKVERSTYDDLPGDVFERRKKTTKVIGVAHSAVHLAESIGAKAIGVLSATGQTATMISQLRPQDAAIIVFTDNEQVLRQLSLIWGCEGIQIPKPKDRKGFIQNARTEILKAKIAKKGDYIVIVTGFIKKDLALAEAVEI